MGRIVTPPYRVEYRDNLLAMHKTRADALSRVDRKPVLLMAWNGKRDGRPTADNLRKWRAGYNASFEQGGVNYHISLSLGAIARIHFARIVRHRDDVVVAEFNAPAFEAA